MNTVMLQHHISKESPCGLLERSTGERENIGSYIVPLFKIYEDNGNQDSKVVWVLLTILEACEKRDSCHSNIKKCYKMKTSIVYLKRTSFPVARGQNVLKIRINISLYR